MATALEEVLAQQAAPEQPPEPVEAPPPSAPADGEQPPTEPTRLDKLRALLDEVDPTELIEVAKHAKVAGKIGNLAQQQAQAEAKRLADQIVAERDTAAAEARRLQLLTENPYQAAQEELAARTTAAERKVQADREQGIAARVASEITTTVEAHFAKAFPPEVLAATAGKTYEGTYEQGLAARVADLVEQSKAHMRAELLADPALRKQWLSETNGSEPSPDLGAGTNAGSALAFADFNAASAALMAGRITVDQLRQWQVQNSRRR